MRLLLFCLMLQFREPDRIWERWERHNQWMYKLDNSDPKSWVIHSASALGFGSLIGLLPYVSKKQGVEAMLWFYFVRELNGVVREGNEKYVDAYYDWFVPYLSFRIVF